MGAGPPPPGLPAERRGAPLVELRQDVRHGALLGGHDPLERRGRGAARTREERLPVDGRRRAGHPGDGANLGDHGVQVLDRTAPRREDAHVAVPPRSGPDLQLQARHEAERDQDRHHAHRDAHDRHAGDERDECLFLRAVRYRRAMRSCHVIPRDGRLPDPEESLVTPRGSLWTTPEESPGPGIARRPTRTVLLGMAAPAACAGRG